MQLMRPIGCREFMLPRGLLAFDAASGVACRLLLFKGLHAVSASQGLSAVDAESSTHHQAGRCALANCASHTVASNSSLLELLILPFQLLVSLESCTTSKDGLGLTTLQQSACQMQTGT